MDTININKEQLKEIVRKTINLINENFLENNFRLVDYDLTNNKDFNYIKTVSEFLWDTLQKAYEKIGGFKSFKNLTEMLKRANQITIGYYKDEIVAVSVYNDYLGGNKEVGIAAVKGTLHEQGVTLVNEIIKRNIKLWDEWYWVEASSKIEELYLKNDAFAIPNIYVSSIFRGKEITLDDDGFHYYRSIGKEQIEAKKMIFGFKDEEIKKKIESDFPIGYSEKINKIKQGILKETRYSPRITQIEASKYIVDMFIDDFNEGLTQVSKNNYKELKDNLEIIKKHLIDDNCPKNRKRAMKFALEDGYEVLYSLRILKILTNN